MSIAVAGRRVDSGVIVAEVNLKFVWEIISRITVGKAGRAYATDSDGNLIAHPDISLVLKKTNLSSLPQVAAARVLAPEQGEWQRQVSISKDLNGQNVLTAYAGISPLGWFVFLEQPLEEAFEPLYASIYRTASLLFIGIALSVLASFMLARRLVKPIRALQQGAALVAAGELGHRIEIRTGDELESLGEALFLSPAFRADCVFGRQQYSREPPQRDRGSILRPARIHRLFRNARAGRGDGSPARVSRDRGAYDFSF